MSSTKQFKLIKEYPGSPKLGSTVIWTRYSHALPRYLLSLSGNTLSTSVDFTKEEIENFPEFWEEVKPKEWEILAYSFKPSGTKDLIYNYAGEGDLGRRYLCGNGQIDEQTVHQLKTAKIHSVKRLSDNEVFTIGNSVNILNDNYLGTFSIMGFHIAHYGNRQSMMVEKDETRAVNIKLITKVKQSLFVTEDGVEVFEEQPCVAIILPTFTIMHTSPGRYPNNSLGQNVRYKNFSTEKAALDYIAENKPQYSLKDVREACSVLQQTGQESNTTFNLCIKPNLQNIRK